jgi:hypothetical protein
MEGTWMTASLRRWSGLVLVLIAGAALMLAPPTTVRAQPSNPVEDDGGTPLLRDVLNVTGRNYSKAKAAAQASKKRQLQLSLQVRASRARLDELSPQIGTLAAESYRTGRVGAAAVLLASSSPDSFLERALALNEMNIFNDRKLHELKVAIDQLSRAKLALDAEVRREQNQLLVMAKQKQEAEKALALVGGDRLTGGLVAATSPVARPAPRRADGTFANESCTKEDPTTSGCLTPRTLHAYKETRRAGFTRFAGCFRSGGPFEHPKGLACDWSLRENGFSPASTRDQRLYGNNLAAFLVRNADRLGILYVIWNRQIWFPATGWKSYRGNSAHTDHIHMSML